VNIDIQCESKKIRPEDLWQYFQNEWEFFNQILHAYHAFLSTLYYEFLFNYLQVWRNYAILSVTTQLKSCAKMSTISQNAFSDIFPKQLWIFSPNFTRLLSFIRTLECKLLFNYLQLWRSYDILSTTTQRAIRSMVNIHIMVVALNMA